MNDVTFTECEFGADMVPYMYAELPAKKSAAFEAHLLLCSACTDEFASLSNARYEVYDWKKLEFDGLATPTFEAPFESGPEHIAPTWADKIREAFSGSWAIPGIAFASLSVVSLLGALIVLSARNNEVAVKIDPPNSRVEEPVDRPAPEKEKAPFQIEPKREVPSNVSVRPAELVRSSTAKPATRRPEVRDVRTNSRSYELTQVSSRTKQKKIPRLNDFAEDEDTSLRLAELFDDLDTRN